MSTTVDRTQDGAAPQTPAHEIVRVSVPQRSLSSELRAIRIVWRRELIRFKSDRLRIVTSLVQPLLFLFVLGSGLQSIANAGTHGVDLKTFIYPGILCIAVMFTAMFSAASIVWDMEPVYVPRHPVPRDRTRWEEGPGSSAARASPEMARPRYFAANRTSGHWGETEGPKRPVQEKPPACRPSGPPARPATPC